MEDVFRFRDQVVSDYSEFSRSFTRIAAGDIRDAVDSEYAAGRYWPEPLIQINPNYQRKATVQTLSEHGELHPGCATLFLSGKPEGDPRPLQLFAHQIEALAKGKSKQSFVVTTGTGSGKSLSFFLPIVDHVLRSKSVDSAPRTCAIVIYPMNALANSQMEELEKFLCDFPEGSRPFTVGRYTGQESQSERLQIADCPPDILLTNFMMLELIMTRHDDTDRRVVEHCRGLQFLVLDELHTYRGRQGADVAMLVRRLRERLNAEDLVCIGTSATMSSAGNPADRNRTVADVASKLFGVRVSEHDVIGETLERVTDQSKDVAAVCPLLLAEVQREEFSWPDLGAFQKSPLAIWVELTLGIELNGDEAPRRARPVTLHQASQRLMVDAGCSQGEAKTALQRFLVAANELRTPLGRAPFAFKLHQFISGPGKVLTTLEAPGKRHVTLDAQRFAPGRQGEGVRLYPAHFCRDCGQEYHPVWRTEQGSHIQFDPREIDDMTAEDADAARFGFLCPQSDQLAYTGSIEDLPEGWLDLTRSEPKVKSSYRAAVPTPTRVDAQGLEGRGEPYWFIPGKFRFCLACREVHEAHGKDINRLSSLSGEGRSSATTMLTVSALSLLFRQADLPAGMPDPRKLLGFSDNRQDAALQAGHFNDFVFLLTLRAALIGALKASQGVLTEEHLADAVFTSLGFQQVDVATLSEYLRSPKLMGLARQEAQRTLRFVIGYRLLRDLRRGWRFNNPNLDQLGLLAIRYRGMQEFCSEESLFVPQDSVLGRLDAASRAELFQLLFDEMRRGLCLESRYLDPTEQDKARNSAFSYLHERWAFAPDESLETARFLILDRRPEYRGRPRTDVVAGGPRSRLLKRVKSSKVWKATPFADQTHAWRETEWAELIKAMLQAAALYGYVHKLAVDNELVGWRLNAAAMDWCLVSEDPKPSAANTFFRQLYLQIGELLRQPGHPLFEFEAQEHTAQVEASRRQWLEQRFRYSEKDRKDWAQNPAHETPLERLPVMFCSPTMELGVDISALNTVFLRNVPPTPANYAQRSGRAGRSGQQALVITYCAAQSPHDQWFFSHADEMVHGVVKPPTLDLANRDLLESHLRAIWLASTRVELDSSIAPLLDLDLPGKPVKGPLHELLSATDVLARARTSARTVAARLRESLQEVDWFTEDYVDKVIEGSPGMFSGALERWRVLFDSTRKQMDLADQIVKSHTATHGERQNASRRYGDAARQYAVLLKSGNSQGTDFYTYRYLASQGFLPGYNFPRLPLMAWIPARGGSGAGAADDEGNMVSRPRFLALSEFGPRSLIYHQGRMYRVVRAKLNVGAAEHVSGSGLLSTIASRICSQCGYGHLGEPGDPEPLAERCEHCDALLTEGDWVKQLYRIETVETVAVERISINDEDRQRQGFELQTTYRFMPGPDGEIQKRQAEVRLGEDVLAGLVYTPSARLWRINRGWRRRKNKEQLGFYINPITGTWSKQDDPTADDSSQNADEASIDKIPNQRIVPFVEDHRNLLTLSPVRPLSLTTMATLQAALKRGIEMSFQIEESELVAEPLPTSDNRRALMFYESAEGGAGVLTRLATDPDALAQVASAALELMHYKAPEGVWIRSELDQWEERRNGIATCEAGCYRCLLSYFNQPDHDHINRRDSDVLDLLVALAQSRVSLTSHVGSTPDDDPNPSSSEWLQALRTRGLREPDALNVVVAGGAASAAGQYRQSRALVFIDPLADHLRSLLVDKGWQVLDFSDQARWSELFSLHPTVFGSTQN